MSKPLPGRRAAAPIDWQEIGRQVERSLAALGDAQADPASDRRILEQRALALAMPAPAPAADGGADWIEVLVFEAGGERYAFETAWVAQVGPLPPITVIPGVPNHVVGIAALNGEALAVIDLRSLLALPLARIADPAGLVVLRCERMEFGVLAEAIVGVERHARSALEPGLATLPGIETSYLHGITPERTAILDAQQLLADPRLVVDAGR